MRDYLVTYDIATTTREGELRLRRVAKICEGYGTRVQFSVFECVLDEAARLLLVARLHEAIDHAADNVRIYPLGGDVRKLVTNMGRVGPPDVRDPLVF